MLNVEVCGREKTLAQLKLIPVDRPERASDRGHGVSHHELATGLLGEFQDREIDVVGHRWATDKTNQVLVGAIEVKFPEEFDVPEIAGMGYCLGVRHSNDLRYALVGAVGARVFACSNGVITGQFVMSRRHTKNIDLDEQIYNGITRFIREARGVSFFVDTLQERKLSDSDSDRILMEAGRQRLIPWSRIGRIDREYHNPSCEEFEPGNAWGLYNAFTRYVQLSPPHDQMRAIAGFRPVILGEKPETYLGN